MGSLVHFSGHQHLRQRLVLSILSGKHVRIDKIRSDDKNPGLRGLYHILLVQVNFLNLAATDFEISLLRLLEKVTNGTIIEISVTGSFAIHFYPSSPAYDCNIGTAILLKPGIISGGVLSHDCPLSRSIGYYLEPVVMLAPFSKKPLQLTLHGITTDENDLSVCRPMKFTYCSC